MSKRAIGVLLLVVASEILGLLAGNWFFGLFARTVPPAVLTDFNRNAARAYFLLYGAILGLGFAAWALLAIGLARLFRARPPEHGPGGEEMP